jgi:hypothetical protein
VGEVAVGGGYTVAGGNFTNPMSRPNPSAAGGEPNGWTASVVQSGGGTRTITVYSVCLPG